MFETDVKATATSSAYYCYDRWMSQSAYIPTILCALSLFTDGFNPDGFVLAMVSYPDFPRRAQAEIDSVIGQDRVPTFENSASLQYVESILRETMRWQPIAPLGSFPR
ncbi:uncharacterized protein EDB93DRAFT_310917 [Suillus bovinus]|uniref:uncharacterized protein n=1 Tax=Suillus bovinus TaxID=48563 RepID=UPI001B86EB61|nr:uncharacterized protein EDB93DRAFT_310917 [Suillus bovinus]KAG2126247.1 hypothetical protein EDB93DRAFT_310917 [Suillus bovinus]